MDADTKRGYKAMLVLVAFFLYLQLWVWLWQSSKDDRFHSLVIVAFMAVPLIVWVVYKNSIKRHDISPAGSPGKGQSMIERNQSSIEQLRKEEDERNARLKQMHEEQVASLAEQILRRNQDLIDKFLEIAERKVSVLDAYGDEQRDLLPDEVLLCMKKIAQREGWSIDWNEYSKAKRRGKRDTDFVLLSGRYKQLNSLIPEEYQLMEKRLTQFFNGYHESGRARPHEEVDVDALSAVEFETHIATILRSRGYDVSGTPTTGDQGADLVAKKNGKTYIIQAKRYQGTVGNKAVQEVISAVSYYGGDEGWVITNSRFTPSAVALAQKANIRLIDGVTLRTNPF